MDLLFAFIAHIGWAVGDIFGVITARKLGGPAVTFWSMAVSFFLASCTLPFFLSDFSRITLPLGIFTVVLSFFLLGGHLAFNEGLRIGNPTLVGVISASFVALSVVLSVSLLKESVSALQLFALVLIFFGVALSIIDRLELRSAVSFGRGELLALCAMFLWGIYYTFIKVIIAQVGWFLPNYIFLCFFPLVFIGLRLGKISLHAPEVKTVFFPLLGGSALISAAEFSYNRAVSGGPTSFILPIAGSYPALYVLLSSLFFHAKLRKHQIVGIALSLSGICILSFLQPPPP